MKDKKASKNSSEKKVYRGVVEKIICAGNKVKNGISQDQVLANYILGNDSFHGFEKSFTNLIKFPVIRNKFNAFERNLERWDRRPSYKPDYQKIVSMYISFFLFKNEEISIFLKKINEFEKSYSSLNFDQAKLVLDDIELRFGESLWLIRSRMTLLNAMGGQLLPEYYKRLKDREKTSFINNCINQFYDLATSTDPSIIIDVLISRNMSEYIEGNAKELTAIYSYFFIPKLFYSTRDISSLLYQIQRFCIFDQYLMFVEWISNEVVLDEKLSCLKNNINRLQILAETIGDGVLISVLNNKIDVVQYSDIENKIIDLYEIGEYKEVINLIRNEGAGIECLISYVNIYAKSLAYLNLEVDGIKSLFNQCAHHLKNIYELDKSSSQSFHELKNKIIIHSHFRSSILLYVSLIKACPAAFEGEMASYILKFCNITNFKTTPLVRKMIESIKDSNKEIPFYNIRPNLKNLSNVPDYRTIRNELSLDREGGEYAEEKLNQLEKCDLLRKDVIESKIGHLLVCRKYSDAIAYAAELLVDSPSTYLSIPISFLANYIKESKTVTICSVIVLYFHTKYISMADVSYLHESIEDLIWNNQCERPSSYLENRLNNITKKEIFFFSEVCTRVNIDYLACFKDSVDLASERLKILDLLLRIQESNSYYHEQNEIFDDVIMEECKAKFDSNKISVNTEVIKSLKVYDVESSIFQYWNPQALEEVAEQQQDNPDLVYGYKNSIVLKIFESVLVSFLFNETHGLDKNISTEIRHGFFSNLMRSRLEENSLLLELDRNKRFIASPHWEVVHQYVSKPLREKILERLSLFTKQFNSLVAEAEAYLKITLNVDENKFCKIFNPSSGLINEIGLIVDSRADSELIIDYVLKSIWDMTERYLSVIREYLNEEFKERLDQIFINLIDSLNRDKGTIPLLELTAAVNQVKNEIREDIKTASGWLYRGDNIVFESIKLNTVIDIAIKNFSELKGININITKFSSESDIHIDGDHIRAFIHALIIFLNNSIMHGRCNNEDAVVIDVSTSGNSYKVAVKNRVFRSDFDGLSGSKMDSIKMKVFEGETSDFLLRSEGGSGLKKARHLLKSVSNFFELNISFKEEYFISEVIYVEQVADY